MKSKKVLEQQLDIAWSKAVKIAGNNQCLVCGKRINLESHHIKGRSNKTTRWFLSNGVCLCKLHHTEDIKMSAHITPERFENYLRENKGDDFFDTLVYASNQIANFSAYELEDKLIELHQYIKDNE